MIAQLWERLPAGMRETILVLAALLGAALWGAAVLWVVLPVPGPWMPMALAIAWSWLGPFFVVSAMFGAIQAGVEAEEEEK